MFKIQWVFIAFLKMSEMMCFGQAERWVPEVEDFRRARIIYYRRLGVKTGAERRTQPGIQAQRPRTRTARTTRQINGAIPFSS